MIVRLIIFRNPWFVTCCPLRKSFKAFSQLSYLREFKSFLKIVNITLVEPFESTSFVAASKEM